MEILSYKKIRLAITVFLLLSFVLVGLAIYKSLQNPYGNQLEISDINNYTSGKPTDKDIFNFIKHDLYQTVSLNINHPIASDSIKDISIRNESFSQTYDKSTNIYTVHFIVDIKSLQQSYRVEYQWSPGNKYSSNLSEYGTQITCLPLTELIYGNFNCKDENALGVGVKNYDQVALLLPYHVIGKFTVKSYTKLNNRTTLEVDAYAPADALSVNQTLLDSYTQDINNWLKSNQLDPSKYTIDYNY